MNHKYRLFAVSPVLKQLAIALGLVLTSQTPAFAKDSSADYQTLIERLNRQDEAVRLLEAEVRALIA